MTRRTCLTWYGLASLPIRCKPMRSTPGLRKVWWPPRMCSSNPRRRSRAHKSLNRMLASERPLRILCTKRDRRLNFIPPACKRGLGGGYVLDHRQIRMTWHNYNPYRNPQQHRSLTPALSLKGEGAGELALRQAQGERGVRRIVFTAPTRRQTPRSRGPRLPRTASRRDGTTPWPRCP